MYTNGDCDKLREVYVFHTDPPASSPYIPLPPDLLGTVTHTLVGHDKGPLPVLLFVWPVGLSWLWVSHSILVVLSYRINYVYISFHCLSLPTCMSLYLVRYIGYYDRKPKLGENEKWHHGLFCSLETLREVEFHVKSLFISLLARCSSSFLQQRIQRKERARNGGSVSHFKLS